MRANGGAGARGIDEAALDVWDLVRMLRSEEGDVSRVSRKVARVAREGFLLNLLSWRIRH